MPEHYFRRFVLRRTHDVSGVSGTGIVAWGCEFPDGTVTIRWCVEGLPASTVVWANLEEAIQIHGHDGATTVVFVDWSTADSLRLEGV